MASDSNNTESIETAIQKIGSIVSQLEQENTSLAEALENFQEGIALIRSSQQTLELTEQRVNEIIESGVKSSTDEAHPDTEEGK